MDEGIKRLRARVSGRVQGVSFRYFVFENAQHLGVYGWVRNRRDGSVEILAEGKQIALENLVKAAWQGPRSSDVQDVVTGWETPTGEFARFRIRMTR